MTLLILFEPWFSHLKNGIKTIEGRRGTKDTLKNITEIEFKCPNKAKTLKKNKFMQDANLNDFLLNEPLQNLLPGIKSI